MLQNLQLYTLLGAEIQRQLREDREKRDKPLVLPGTPYRKINPIFQH
jgi:hypothetical protein